MKNSTYNPDVCEHEPYEDCMNCCICGKCSETLDEDDVCSGCRKKCNVRWDEPLSYQDKHLFFENKTQFDKFRNKYNEVLRFVSHATAFHKDGTVTMTI